MAITKFKKLISVLSKNNYRFQLLQNGVAAGVEHERVLKNLSYRAVVDVGANRGQFALAARQCCPDAIIVSFEPLAGPANLYRKVFARDAKVTLFQTAVGPTSGQTTIHISQRDDSSSLLPITAMQNNLFPGTAEAATETVSVGPLDQFISADEIIQPALLKLDVQGFELEVLKGCEKLLDRFQYVYAECSFVELYQGQAMAGDVIAWLRERGFSLDGVYNMSYDRQGKAIQADFLFKSIYDTNNLPPSA